MNKVDCFFLVWSGLERNWKNKEEHECSGCRVSYTVELSCERGGKGCYIYFIQKVNSECKGEGRRLIVIRAK